MKFRVFLPESETKVPAIYCLAGLTCTEETFITKSGAIEVASKHGIALICPDTSPRNCNIQGETDSWDFGVGAGFYINAKTELFKNNYNMQSYITNELYYLIVSNLPIDVNRQSILGHSMGGHGALISFLKHQGKYKSVSAFAPICNPSHENSKWGQKAFKGYFGDEDKSEWVLNDATKLIENFKGNKVEILIDQGDKDQFLEGLMPEHFKEACERNNYPLKLRYQEGYDHSYYFIQSFVKEHIEFHAKYLK